MYLLSICIPTYERPDDLFKCLSAIFSTNKSLLSMIEICISDNASTYDFNTLMEKFQKNNNLKYKINTENIGFDRNLLETINMASAPYLLFLGNDDIINEKGLEDVINILRNYGPDAILTNYSIFYTDSLRTYNAYEQVNVRLDLKFDEILISLKEKITFFSSIIVNKKKLNLEANFINTYIDKHFLHIALLLGSLKKSDRIAYIPSPIVTATNRNKATYNIKALFLYDLGQIVNSFANSYSPKAIKTFKHSVLAHVVYSGASVNVKDLVEFKLLTPYGIVMLFVSKSRWSTKVCRYITSSSARLIGYSKRIVSASTAKDTDKGNVHGGSLG